MTLTVPRAGVAAGRAPAITVQENEGPSVVAEFGARVAQAGDRILGDALDRQATRLQIDMTRALGEARLELEQQNDPDAIDAGWQARSAELRKRFVEGDPATPLHPRLRERVGLAFDELANRHALALGGRAVEARRNQRGAQWLEYSTEVLAQARTADAGTRQTLIDQATRRVDDDLAAGVITPFEAAQRKIAIRDDAARTAARSLVDDNPQGFLERVEAGEFADMEADALQTYVGRAEANIRQAEAQAARDAEATERDRQKGIGNQLGLIADIARRDGVTAAETDFLATPDARAHPDFGRAMAAVQLRDDIPQLATMSPPELEALLREERQKPRTALYQLERVDVLERLLEETRAGWNGDGVSYARDKGFLVPDLPAWDPGDPASFERGLRDRLTFASRALAEGYTARPPILSDEEIASLREAASVSADPAARAELAKSLWRATDGQLGPVAGLIDADPVFAHAAGMIGQTGSSAVAREMFRGQQKIAAGTVNLPSAADQNAVIFDVTGGILSDDPALGQIKQAALALYADAAAGLNPEEVRNEGRWLDTSDARAIFERSVQRALGATVDGSGQLRIGGVQELSTGFLDFGTVVLPPGVHVEAAGEALDRTLTMLAGATRAADGTLVRPDPLRLAETTPPLEERLSILARASLSGAAPDLGDEPNLAFANTRLVMVGDDSYSLVFQRDDGGEEPVLQADGRPYRLSLRRLIREARP